MADRIEVIFDADADRVVTESRRAGAAVTAFGRTVTAQGRAGAAFSAVVAQQRRNLDDLVRVAQRAAIFLGGLFVAGAAKGIQLNAQWESLNASLTTLIGSSKEAAKFLEELRQVSQESPLRLTEYAEAAQLMLGFGVETEKVLPLLEAVNMAVVATGKGEEEMMRVVLALGQMQSKGKASAEELNQLAEVGVPVNKILQRELGLTGEEVANIGNEGVRAEDALAAIGRGWRREYQAGYRNARDTFSFQLSDLKKDFEQALRLGSEPLFEMFRDDVLPRLNEELGVLVGILQRDIPDARKFQLIREHIAGLVRELGELGLDEKLLEAFNDAIPKLAEAAARGAGKVAEAFANGFLNSDIWGKLVLGGLLISKLGLGSVIFRRAGATAGAAFAAGMAQTGVMGVPYAAGAAGMRGRLGGAARTAGRIGLWGAGLGGAMGAIGSTDFGAGGRIQNALSGASLGLIQGKDAKAAEVLAEALAKVNDGMRALRGGASTSAADVHAFRESVEQTTGVLVDLGAISEEQAAQVVAAADRQREAWFRTENRMDKVRETFRGLLVTSVDSVGEIRREVERGMRAVERSFGSHSRRGKELLAENIDLAIDAIRRGMETGKIATGKGMAEIQRLLGQQLKLYGVELRDVFAGRPVSTSTSQKGPGVRTNQRGGFINTGAAEGDSVPSLLERGEYVLNRNAVAAMGGKATLDAINYGMAARFQRGGYAGVSGDTDFSPALGNALSRMARSAGRSIYVQSGGRTMAEQAALYARYQAGTGNLAAPPNPNAPHVRGIAADITPGREVFGGMAGRFGLGFTVPSESWHIELLSGGKGAVLRGPGGVKIKLPRFRAQHEMFAPAAGGLSNLSAAIEKEAGRRVAALMPEGVSGASGGAITAKGAGAWQEALRQIARKRGWSASDWMNLVMRESSGNPGATNPSSGAFGLGQFLGATAQAYAKYGALSQNPVKQIEAMARYIADRYGTPTRALAFHDANNWYQRGGEAGGARGVDELRKALRRAMGRRDDDDATKRDRRLATKRVERLEDFLEAARSRRRGARETRREVRAGRMLGRQLEANLGPLLEGLGGSLVGSFDRGTFRVPRTGLARVHAGEEIVRNTGPARPDERPLNVHLHLDGNLTPLVQTMRGEIEGYGVRVIDRELGRRARVMSFAPGG